MRRALTFVLVLTALVLPSRGAEVAPVSVGGVVCSPFEPLAAAVGAPVTWREAQRWGRAVAGGRFLELRLGQVLASDARGLVLLPTCPFQRDGVLLAPTQAVAERLGAKVTAGADGLRVLLGDRLVLVVQPPAAPSPPTDRLRAALDDPRVDLTARLDSLSRGESARWYLDQFNKTAAPATPLLAAVGQSKSLRLLGRVPLVGDLISAAQDTSGALSEALKLSTKVADYDEARWAPLRRALQGAVDVREASSPERLAAARAAWQAAVPALQAQVEDLDGLATRARLAQLGLGLLDGKLKALQEKYPKVDFDLSLAGLHHAVGQFVIWSQGARWDRQTLREYLEGLLAETAAP